MQIILPSMRSRFQPVTLETRIWIREFFWVGCLFHVGRRPHLTTIRDILNRTGKHSLEVAATTLAQKFDKQPTKATTLDRAQTFDTPH